MTTLSTGEPWSIRRTDELHRVSNKRTVWSYEPIYTVCSSKNTTSVSNVTRWNNCQNTLLLYTVIITKIIFFINITVAEYTTTAGCFLPALPAVTTPWMRDEDHQLPLLPSLSSCRWQWWQHDNGCSGVADVRWSTQTFRDNMTQLLANCHARWQSCNY